MHIKYRFIKRFKLVDTIKSTKIEINLQKLMKHIEIKLQV